MPEAQRHSNGTAAQRRHSLSSASTSCISISSAQSSPKIAWAEDSSTVEDMPSAERVPPRSSRHSSKVRPFSGNKADDCQNWGLGAALACEPSPPPSPTVALSPPRDSLKSAATDSMVRLSLRSSASSTPPLGRVSLRSPRTDAADELESTRSGSPTRSSKASSVSTKANFSIKARSRSMRVTQNDSAKMHAELRHTLEEERKEEEKQKDLKRLPVWQELPRRIVEHPCFVGLTTLLTIYALVGDDLRLLCTNKPSDPIFNWITGLCLLTFTTEVVLSSIGKAEYWLSFFFWLDLVSTVTLILDITTVNDFIFQAGDDADGSAMKSSRTARIGARAARIVRVLRLVRILKLYKTVYEMQARSAKQAKEKQDEIMRHKSTELDEDWDEDAQEDGDDLHALEESVQTESNVGKKLSDLTTRRCVILVLSMIFMNPFLVPPDDMYKGSGSFGADVLREKFEDMRRNPTAKRWLYEEALLRYVYYHNWHNRKTDGGACPDSKFCPAQYDHHMIWLGLSAGDDTDEGTLREKAALAGIRRSTVKSWEKNIVAHKGDRSPTYNYGSMPTGIQHTLGSSWSQECRTTKGLLRVGISLLTEGVDYHVDCPNQLRQVERTPYIAELVKSTGNDIPFIFYFDNRPVVKEEAFMNLWTTFFICVLLCGASMMFTADAQELVLQPLEAMMVKVNLIKLNPLLAATMQDEEFKREAISHAKTLKMQQMPVWRSRLRKLKRILQCLSPTEVKARPMETAILEKTIIKLGTLLALGFGTAGMNIISSNIQNKESANINAMVPGHTVKCIICHARIGDFSTFTEVLQGRVMTFVNQVAEIIHGLVDAFHGASSSNSGQTFLAVWKVLDGDDEEASRHLADMSVIAAALMVAGVNRSLTLDSYRTHPGIQQRLGSSCRVRVNFGFHFGWAIEGALGSEFKIEASYVSPNVSISESVGQAAERYGTYLVLSEAAHEALTADMASRCRRIDRVNMPGAADPMDIFSVDLSPLKLCLESPIEDRIGRMKWTTRQRYRARQKLAREKTARLFEDSMAHIFDTHPDTAQMRKPYTTEFHELFGMCYQNYSQGEWPAATNFLRRATNALGFLDGPCEALRRYMELTAVVPPFAGELADKQAPDWWKGFHALESMPELPKHKCAQLGARHSRSTAASSDGRRSDSGQHCQARGSLSTTSTASTGDGPFDGDQQAVDVEKLRKLACNGNMSWDRLPVFPSRVADLAVRIPGEVLEDLVEDLD